MINYVEKNTPLILVVDDDRFTRIMLRQIMEQEGYKVEEVKDGQQCLAVYESLKPDMVLLDAMMPVMDGFTCCSKLQALSESDGVPVLMITGLNDQASVDWAFEAGAIDYVTKPIHPPVLRRRVRRLFETNWAQNALRKSEKQYRSVVENSKEVIFETDNSGNWKFLNSAWENLMGFTVSESLGTSYRNYVYPDDQQLHQEIWLSLLKREKLACRQEIRYLTKDGQCRWTEINAHATLLEDGGVSIISGTLRDITEHLYAKALEKEKVRLEYEINERERRGEMMREALEKEKELGELKSRVISTISHEFRTPLTAIQSSSEILSNYGQNFSEEKKQKHFQRIEDSIEQMTQLLNDAVFFGQAEAGSVKLNLTSLDLVSFCNQIVENLQLNLDDQHTIAFWEQGEKTKANVDPKLLRQILTNLLSNAVKYSPQGGTISLDLIFQQGKAVFRVEDEGIGIPSEEQTRLFETFYRASNAGTIRGTGLGLAIVKKCVDLHQGEITVESEVGGGTSFTVSIPLNLKPT